MKNRILLVDDKPTNIKIFKKALLDIDVTIEQANSHHEATQLLEDNDVALILLNVQMPGMAEFETLKLIRNNKDWNNIPVILTSSINKNDSYKIEAVKNGAVDFITMPVIHELFINKIKIFLELYEHRLKQNTKFNEISHQLDKLVGKRTKELKLKNKQLRIEKKERKAAIDIINASPLIAFRWKNTEDLPLEYVSENVKRISGYSVNELISGKVKIFDIVHNDDIERVTEELISFANNKEKSTFAHKPYRIRIKNGNILWVEEWIIVIRNREGYITHFQGIVLDITEKVNTANELIIAKEKAIESDKLKTAFLANMSHEIRTPMNAILGFSQLLAIPGITEEEIASYVETIANSGKQLLNLIDDIISISQIEAGIIEVYRKSTGLESLLETSYKLFHLTAAKSNIKFSYKNAVPKQLQIIYTDSRRIQQVLVNLISNAFKFTSDGSIELGCILHNNKFEFYVRDTGIGISKEDEKIIFDRFMQVDHGPDILYGGTGIGLSISKAIIEKLGGEIWATANEDVGATFYFTLPIDQEDEKLNFPSNKIINYSPDLSGKTILIAEDDDDSFELLSILLLMQNANVIRAFNGAEAISFIRSNPNVDLVFMDVKMPVINGLEAAKEIRTFNKKVPIIAQTAYAQTGDRDTTIMAGCNDYISKPILKNLLFELIEKHL